jgi:hypothetical protein
LTLCPRAQAKIRPETTRTRSSLDEDSVAKTRECGRPETWRWDWHAAEGSKKEVDKVVHSGETSDVAMAGQMFEHLRVDRDHLLGKLGEV